MNCKHCGQPLLQVSCNTKYYVFLCDNWHCFLFRQPQAYEEKPQAEPLHKERTGTRRRGYLYYLSQKKENYHLLRKLGIPSYEAALMTSNKQTRLALEMAGVPSP